MLLVGNVNIVKMANNEVKKREIYASGSYGYEKWVVCWITPLIYLMY